jgi:hypothetical protein
LATQLDASSQIIWKPVAKLVQVLERNAVVSIHATSRAWKTISAAASARTTWSTPWRRRTPSRPSHALLSVAATPCCQMTFSDSHRISAAESDVADGEGVGDAADHLADPVTQLGELLREPRQRLAAAPVTTSSVPPEQHDRGDRSDRPA